MAPAYDVVVIGAGPAGYVAAIRGSQLGMKVALVEKTWLGGVCLNVGCIPSKALLRNAELVYVLRHKAKTFGLRFEGFQADYAQAVKRSRKVAQRLTKGVAFLMRKNDVEVHMGTGRILAVGQVQVTPQEGEPYVLETRHIVVATGARPIMLPGVEADGERVLTYKEAILQERLPERPIIIGGGPIGVEFATIWHAYGAQVTVVEMMPHLLPMEDPDLGKALGRSLEKRKIRVLTGHKVTGVEAGQQGVRVRAEGPKGEVTLEGDQVLVAIGFRPNTQDLGLEDVGVRLTPRGAIEIDERMATNVPGIWAIGDVTGKLMLAHVGSAQGIRCMEAIAGREIDPLDYAFMPRAVYSHPQVAAFGLTEPQARERGYRVKTAQFPFQAIGKALALDEYEGWAKLVIDETYGEILGAHLIGPEVTELLPELTLARMMELTAEEIARNVHAHPTLSEILAEVAHAVLGEPIHI